MAEENKFLLMQRLGGRLEDGTKEAIKGVYRMVLNDSGGMIKPEWLLELEGGGEQLNRTTMPEWAKEDLKEISIRDETGLQDVLDYFYLYAEVAARVSAITVYVDIERFFAGHSCVDWRKDTQSLPDGVRVIGYLVRSKGIVLKIPPFSEDQEKHFRRKLGEALLRIGALKVDFKQLIHNQWALIDNRLA